MVLVLDKENKNDPGKGFRNVFGSNPFFYNPENYSFKHWKVNNLESGTVFGEVGILTG